MSENVDVLSVLRAARDSVPAEQLLDYCTAVAAVVELIDANVELAAANADPAHTLGRDLRVINAEKRLRTALARVQGGAA